MDEAASSLVRLTTSAVDPRHRAALVGDTMARTLAGGAIAVTEGDLAVDCDWRLAPLGPGTVLGRVRQRGFTAARNGRLLGDGDADLSLFLGLDGAARFEQNDRRHRLGQGEMLLCAHSRPVQSWWSGEEMMVLRLPRAALAGADRVEAAGGALLDTRSSAVRLLTAYLAALWPLAQAGAAPAFAADHLADLAGLALAEAAGANDARGIARGPAARTARLARMRAVLRRRHADPALDMAAVAAEAGLSERTGYLLFAGAGESFAETLHACRLDRAAERLRNGYAGRLLDLAFEVGFADGSLFNRRFRRRFDMTPSDMRAMAGATR